MVLTIGILQHFNLIPFEIPYLITSLFFIGDIVCVLFWCPFRVIFMKNRCCTTCRIFNWDHLMMFSPMLFIRGFYTWSLIVVAIGVFVLWEILIYLHPERFWEKSNVNLKCSECTDKLCIRNCKEKHLAKIVDESNKDE